MQMVPATQLTPLPKQACLAKASCNLSTCSDLLGQCWLHVISMTSFFNGIQQFQGLCALHPRQFQIKEKLQSYWEKNWSKPTFQSPPMHKLILSTCWNVDHGRQTPGGVCCKYLRSWCCIWPLVLPLKKILVLQLFGVTTVWNLFKTQTKDQRPAAS